VYPGTHFPIVNLVPKLELVIGKQPPVADLTPQEAKNRFQTVFRRFLGAFASKEHPLAHELPFNLWVERAECEFFYRRLRKSRAWIRSCRNL
jgi:hypothetical protein